jgi:hypothetical protein
VVAALEYLHGLGIWHRDLKPSNILVRSLEPLDLVLADFGMSRVGDGSYALVSRVVSLGYSPPERATSAAGDWWSLGMIVAELALGRNVFQLESGEWVDEAIFDEWLRTRRPLDFSAIADPRLRRLCQGLTRWDRANRWGADQVRAWLAGEDPPVINEESRPVSPRSASPFPFTDPATGKSRPFTDPAELANAMAQNWEQACEVLSGTAEHRTDQRALRSFLRSLGLSEAEQILADQGDVEERLTRLLVLLDPSIPPVFRGYSIDRDGLLALSRATAEGAQAALDAIFTHRILLNYARNPAHADLAELDTQWHDQLSQFETAIASVQPETGLGGSRAPELAAAVPRAGAQILEVLLATDTRSRLLARADAANEDAGARRQPWYAQLADRTDMGEPAHGHALAMIVLRPLAVRLADAADRERELQLRQQHLAARARRRERRRRALSRVPVKSLVALIVVAGGIVAWRVVAARDRANAIKALMATVPASLRPCATAAVPGNFPAYFGLSCDSGHLRIWMANSAGELPQMLSHYSLSSSCPWLGFTTWEESASTSYGTDYCGGDALVWCDQSGPYIGTIIGLRPAQSVSVFRRWYTGPPGTIDYQEHIQPSAYNDPGACA